MNSTDDRIKVNNSNTAVITHKFWLHDSETCLRVGFIAAEDQPVDQRTWIVYTINFASSEKEKKKKNSCDGHSLHARKISIFSTKVVSP